MDRTLVRAESVSEAAVPDDAIVIDRLDRPSKRVCTILYIDAVQGEKALRSELLNGDAYVLRLPAEQQGQLGTGMLDGRVVTIGDADNQAYRIRTTREQIVEPAHTVVAIEVAADRKTFRDVVFATRIDVTLSPSTLSEAVRTRLERTIRTHTHTETKPLSDAFEQLLTILELTRSADEWRWLFYDDRLYEYALFVSEPS